MCGRRRWGPGGLNGDMGMRIFEGNDTAGWMTLLPRLALSQLQGLLRFWGTERQPDGEVASLAWRAV
jgi:hypothetical protein